MARSTIYLLAASMMCAPAWIVDVKALPPVIQAAWITGVIAVALLAGVVLAQDGK